MTKHTLHSSSELPHLASSSQGHGVVQQGNARSFSKDDIAKRAYEKYEARGRTHGFDREDWTAASHELIRETFGRSSLSPSRAISALPDDKEFPGT
jgi:hypothetical protein